MLNYLLCLVVFTMLLTTDIKHVLPPAVGLQNNNRMAETTLQQTITKTTINDYGLIIKWIKHRQMYTQ